MLFGQRGPLSTKWCCLILSCSHDTLYTHICTHIHRSTYIFTYIHANI